MSASEAFSLPLSSWAPSPLHAVADLTLTIDLTAFTKLRGSDAVSLLSQLARQELRYRPAIINSLREIYRFIVDRDALTVRHASFVNFVGAVVGATFPQLPAAGVDALVDRLWVNAATVSVDDSVSQLVKHARELYSTSVRNRDSDVRAVGRARSPMRGGARTGSQARRRNSRVSTAGGAREAAEDVPALQRLLIDINSSGADVRGGSALASRQGPRIKAVIASAASGQLGADGPPTDAPPGCASEGAPGCAAAERPTTGDEAGPGGVSPEGGPAVGASPALPASISRRQLYQALFWLADTLTATAQEAEYVSFLQFWLAVVQTGVLALPAGPRAVLTYARAMGARVHAVAVVPDPRTPDFRVFCAAIVQSRDEAAAFAAAALTGRSQHALDLEPTINRVRSPSKPSRGAGFAPASPMGGAASPSRRAAPGASAADDALVWMAESAPLMDLTSGIRAARTPRLLALGGGGGGGAAAAAAAAAGRRPSTGESDDRGGEGVVVDVAFFPWRRFHTSDYTSISRLLQAVRDEAAADATAAEARKQSEASAPAAGSEAPGAAAAEPPPPEPKPKGPVLAPGGVFLATLEVMALLALHSSNDASVAARADVARFTRRQHAAFQRAAADGTGGAAAWAGGVEVPPGESSSGSASGSEDDEEGEEEGGASPGRGKFALSARAVERQAQARRTIERMATTKRTAAVFAAAASAAVDADTMMEDGDGEDDEIHVGAIALRVNARMPPDPLQAQTLALSAVVPAGPQELRAILAPASALQTSLMPTALAAQHQGLGGSVRVAFGSGATAAHPASAAPGLRLTDGLDEDLPKSSSMGASANVLRPGAWLREHGDVYANVRAQAMLDAARLAWIRRVRVLLYRAQLGEQRTAVRSVLEHAKRQPTRAASLASQIEDSIPEPPPSIGRRLLGKLRKSVHVARVVVASKTVSKDFAEADSAVPKPDTEGASALPLSDAAPGGSGAKASPPVLHAADSDGGSHGSGSDSGGGEAAAARPAPPPAPLLIANAISRRSAEHLLTTLGPVPTLVLADLKLVPGGIDGAPDAADGGAQTVMRSARRASLSRPAGTLGDTDFSAMVDAVRAREDAMGELRPAGSRAYAAAPAPSEPAVAPAAVAAVAVSPPAAAADVAAMSAPPSVGELGAAAAAPAPAAAPVAAAAPAPPPPKRPQVRLVSAGTSAAAVALLQSRVDELDTATRTLPPELGIGPGFLARKWELIGVRPMRMLGVATAAPAPLSAAGGGRRTSAASPDASRMSGMSANQQRSPRLSGTAPEVWPRTAWRGSPSRSPPPPPPPSELASVAGLGMGPLAGAGLMFSTAVAAGASGEFPPTGTPPLFWAGHASPPPDTAPRLTEKHRLEMVLSDAVVDVTVRSLETVHGVRTAIRPDAPPPTPAFLPPHAGRRGGGATAGSEGGVPPPQRWRAEQVEILEAHPQSRPLLYSTGPQGRLSSSVDSAGGTSSAAAALATMPTESTVAVARVCAAPVFVGTSQEGWAWEAFVAVTPAGAIINCVPPPPADLWTACAAQGTAGDVAALRPLHELVTCDAPQPAEVASSPGHRAQSAASARRASVASALADRRKSAVAPNASPGSSASPPPPPAGRASMGGGAGISISDKRGSGGALAAGGDAAGPARKVTAATAAAGAPVPLPARPEAAEASASDDDETASSDCSDHTPGRRRDPTAGPDDIDALPLRSVSEMRADGESDHGHGRRANGAPTWRLRGGRRGDRWAGIPGEPAAAYVPPWVVTDTRPAAAVLLPREGCRAWTANLRERATVAQWEVRLASQQPVPPRTALDEPRPPRYVVTGGYPAADRRASAAGSMAPGASLDMYASMASFAMGVSGVASVTSEVIGVASSASTAPPPQSLFAAQARRAANALERGARDLQWLAATAAALPLLSSSPLNSSAPVRAPRTRGIGRATLAELQSPLPSRGAQPHVLLSLGYYADQRSAAKAFDAVMRAAHGAAAVTNYDLAGRLIPRPTLLSVLGEDGPPAVAQDASAVATTAAIAASAAQAAVGQPSRGRQSRGAAAAATAAAAAVAAEKTREREAALREEFEDPAQSTVVALPRLFWPERYHAAYSDALSERGLAEDGSGWLSIVAPQHALWQFHPARAELMYSRAQAAVAALHAQRRAIIERLRVLPGGTADRNSVLSALLAPPSLSRVLPKTAALSAGQAAAAPSGSIDAMLMALRTSRPVAGEAGEPTDGIACIAPAIAGSQLRFGKAALGAHAAAEPMSDPALTSVSGWVESDVPLPDLAELVLSVAKRSAVVRTSVVLNGLLGRQLSEVVRITRLHLTQGDESGDLAANAAATAFATAASAPLDSSIFAARLMHADVISDAAVCALLARLGHRVPLLAPVPGPDAGILDASVAASAGGADLAGGTGRVAVAGAPLGPSHDALTGRPRLMSQGRAAQNPLRANTAGPERRDFSEVRSLQRAAAAVAAAYEAHLSAAAVEGATPAVTAFASDDAGAEFTLRSPSNDALPQPRGDASKLQFNFSGGAAAQPGAGAGARRASASPDATDVATSHEGAGEEGGLRPGSMGARVLALRAKSKARTDSIVSKGNSVASRVSGPSVDVHGGAYDDDRGSGAAHDVERSSGAAPDGSRSTAAARDGQQGTRDGAPNRRVAKPKKEAKATAGTRSLAAVESLAENDGTGAILDDEQEGGDAGQASGWGIGDDDALDAPDSWAATGTAPSSTQRAGVPAHLNSSRLRSGAVAPAQAGIRSGATHTGGRAEPSSHAAAPTVAAPPSLRPHVPSAGNPAGGSRRGRAGARLSAAPSASQLVPLVMAAAIARASTDDVAIHGSAGSGSVDALEEALQKEGAADDEDEDDGMEGVTTWGMGIGVPARTSSVTERRRKSSVAHDAEYIALRAEFPMAVSAMVEVPLMDSRRIDESAFAAALEAGASEATAMSMARSNRVSDHKDDMAFGRAFPQPLHAVPASMQMDPTAKETRALNDYYGELTAPPPAKPRKGRAPVRRAVLHIKPPAARRRTPTPPPEEIVVVLKPPPARVPAPTTVAVAPNLSGSARRESASPASSSPPPSAPPAVGRTTGAGIVAPPPLAEVSALAPGNVMAPPRRASATALVSKRSSRIWRPAGDVDAPWASIRPYHDGITDVDAMRENVLTARLQADQARERWKKTVRRHDVAVKLQADLSSTAADRVYDRAAAISRLRALHESRQSFRSGPSAAGVPRSTHSSVHDAIPLQQALASLIESDLRRKASAALDAGLWGQRRRASAAAVLGAPTRSMLAPRGILAAQTSIGSIGHVSESGSDASDSSAGRLDADTTPEVPRSHTAAGAPVAPVRLIQSVAGTSGDWRALRASSIRQMLHWQNVAVGRDDETPRPSVTWGTVAGKAAASGVQPPRSALAGGNRTSLAQISMTAPSAADAGGLSDGWAPNGLSTRLPPSRRAIEAATAASGISRVSMTRERTTANSLANPNYRSASAAVAVPRAALNGGTAPNTVSAPPAQPVDAAPRSVARTSSMEHSGLAPSSTASLAQATSASSSPATSSPATSSPATSSPATSSPEHHVSAPRRTRATKKARRNSTTKKAAAAAAAAAGPAPSDASSVSSDISDSAVLTIADAARAAVQRAKKEMKLAEKAADEADAFAKAVAAAAEAAAATERSDRLSQRSRISADDIPASRQGSSASNRGTPHQATPPQPRSPLSDSFRRSAAGRPESRFSSASEGGTPDGRVGGASATIARLGAAAKLQLHLQGEQAQSGTRAVSNSARSGKDMAVVSSRITGQRDVSPSSRQSTGSPVRAWLAARDRASRASEAAAALAARRFTLPGAPADTAERVASAEAARAASARRRASMPASPTRSRPDSASGVSPSDHDESRIASGRPPNTDVHSRRSSSAGGRGSVLTQQLLEPPPELQAVRVAEPAATGATTRVALASARSAAKVPSGRQRGDVSFRDARAANAVDAAAVHQPPDAAVDASVIHLYGPPPPSALSLVVEGAGLGEQPPGDAALGVALAVRPYPGSGIIRLVPQTAETRSGSSGDAGTALADFARLHAAELLSGLGAVVVTGRRMGGSAGTTSPPRSQAAPIPPPSAPADATAVRQSGAGVSAPSSTPSPIKALVKGLSLVVAKPRQASSPPLGPIDSIVAGGQRVVSFGDGSSPTRVDPLADVLARAALAIPSLQLQAARGQTQTSREPPLEGWTTGAPPASDELSEHLSNAPPLSPLRGGDLGDLGFTGRAMFATLPASPSSRSRSPPPRYPSPTPPPRYPSPTPHTSRVPLPRHSPPPVDLVVVAQGAPAMPSPRGDQLGPQRFKSAFPAVQQQPLLLPSLQDSDGLLGQSVVRYSRRASVGVPATLVRQSTLLAMSIKAAASFLARAASGAQRRAVAEGLLRLRSEAAQAIVFDTDVASTPQLRRSPVRGPGLAPEPLPVVAAATATQASLHAQQPSNEDVDAHPASLLYTDKGLRHPLWRARDRTVDLLSSALAAPIHAALASASGDATGAIAGPVGAALAALVRGLAQDHILAAAQARQAAAEGGGVADGGALVTSGGAHAAADALGAIGAAGAALGHLVASEAAAVGRDRLRAPGLEARVQALRRRLQEMTVAIPAMAKALRRKGVRRGRRRGGAARRRAAAAAAVDAGAIGPTARSNLYLLATRPEENGGELTMAAAAAAARPQLAVAPLAATAAARLREALGLQATRIAPHRFAPRPPATAASTLTSVTAVTSFDPDAGRAAIEASISPPRPLPPEGDARGGYAVGFAEGGPAGRLSCEGAVGDAAELAATLSADAAAAQAIDAHLSGLLHAALNSARGAYQRRHGRQLRMSDVLGGPAGRTLRRSASASAGGSSSSAAMLPPDAPAPAPPDPSLPDQPWAGSRSPRYNSSSGGAWHSSMTAASAGAALAAPAPSSSSPKGPAQPGGKPQAKPARRGRPPAAAATGGEGGQGQAARGLGRSASASTLATERSGGGSAAAAAAALDLPASILLPDTAPYRDLRQRLSLLAWASTALGEGGTYYRVILQSILRALQAGAGSAPPPPPLRSPRVSGTHPGSDDDEEEGDEDSAAADLAGPRETLEGLGMGFASHVVDRIAARQAAAKVANAAGEAQAERTAFSKWVRTLRLSVEGGAIDLEARQWRARQAARLAAAADQRTAAAERAIFALTPSVPSLAASTSALAGDMPSAPAGGDWPAPHGHMTPAGPPPTPMLKVYASVTAVAASARAAGSCDADGEVSISSLSRGDATSRAAASSREGSMPSLANRSLAGAAPQAARTTTDASDIVLIHPGSAAAAAPPLTAKPHRVEDGGGGGTGSGGSDDEPLRDTSGGHRPAAAGGRVADGLLEQRRRSDAVATLLAPFGRRSHGAPAELLDSLPLAEGDVLHPGTRALQARRIHARRMSADAQSSPPPSRRRHSSSVSAGTAAGGGLAAEPSSPAMAAADDVTTAAATLVLVEFAQARRRDSFALPLAPSAVVDSTGSDSAAALTAPPETRGPDPASQRMLQPQRPAHARSARSLASSNSLLRATFSSGAGVSADGGVGVGAGHPPNPRLRKGRMSDAELSALLLAGGGGGAATGRGAAPVTPPTPASLTVTPPRAAALAGALSAHEDGPARQLLLLPVMPSKGGAETRAAAGVTPRPPAPLAASAVAAGAAAAGGGRRPAGLGRAALLQTPEGAAFRALLALEGGPRGGKGKGKAGRMAAVAPEPGAPPGPVG